MLTSFPPLPGSHQSSAQRLTGELAPRSGLGPRWVPGTIRSRARSGVGRLRGLGFVAEALFLCGPRAQVDLRSERPHPSAPGPSLPLGAPVTLSRGHRLCQSPSAVRSAPAMALGPPDAQDQLPVFKSAAWQRNSICEVPPRQSRRCPQFMILDFQMWPYSEPGPPRPGLVKARGQTRFGWAPRGLLRRGAGTRPRRKGTEGLEAGARQQPRDAQVAGALRPGALERCRLGSRSF